jgi:hypothetical protein
MARVSLSTIGPDATQQEERRDGHHPSCLPVATFAQCPAKPPSPKQHCALYLQSIQIDPQVPTLVGLRRGLGARLGQVAFLLGRVRVPGANNIEAPFLYSPVD